LAGRHRAKIWAREEHYVFLRKEKRERRREEGEEVKNEESDG